MDSKALKTIVLFVLAMIVVLVILIVQLVMTKDVIDRNNKLTNNDKEVVIQTTIQGIKNSKIYNSLFSKIDNNNVYIDIEIDKYTKEKIIVAVKDDKIFVSNNHLDIIGRDNNIYVVNKVEKIVSEKKNAKIEIRQIINIPDIEEYNKLEIVKNSKNIEDKTYNSEIIKQTEYFFDNSELIYIKNINSDNDFYKINTISEVIDESIFNLPSDYDIIDGSSIDIEKII